MFQTKLSRGIISSFFGILIVSIIFGILAYFMGFRGLGYGWPAFWANFSIVWGFVILLGVIWGIFTVSLWWISKAPRK